MKIRILILFTAVGLLGLHVPAGSAIAQQQPVQTRIQQPVISNFNVATVVSVPDAGLTRLGSVSSGASGGTAYGIPFLSGIPWFGRPFKNRGFGNSVSSGTVLMKVRIISNREIEEDILAQAARRESVREFSDPNGSREVQAKADFLTRNIGRTSKNR